MFKKLLLQFVGALVTITLFSVTLIVSGNKLKTIEPIVQPINGYIDIVGQYEQETPQSVDNDEQNTQSAPSEQPVTSEPVTSKAESNSSKQTNSSKPVTSKPTTSTPTATQHTTPSTPTPSQPPIIEIQVDDNLIMGKSQVSANQLVSYVIHNISPKSYYNDLKLNCTLYELAELFLSEGNIEGVRGDIAFCQSIHETGWFRYTGDVKWTQNNYGGIGAIGGGAGGATFATAQQGVRAKIQHLKAYASKLAIVNPIIDPRFQYVTRGIAPKWIDLNGKWAVPGDGYGEAILLKYTNLKNTKVNDTYVSMSKETLTK